MECGYIFSAAQFAADFILSSFYITGVGCPGGGVGWLEPVGPWEGLTTRYILIIGHSVANCNLEFELRYLKNLKLFSIGVK